MEERFKNNVYSCLVYEHKGYGPKNDISLYIKPSDNFLDKAVLAESRENADSIFNKWDTQENKQGNTQGNSQRILI